MGTFNSIRAFMYWPKSVPVKEEKGVRDKKRDRDTRRARDAQKRHANYGPSLPVSIPTLGDSFGANLRGANCANCASLAGAEPGVHPAPGGVYGSSDRVVR